MKEKRSESVNSHNDTLPRYELYMTNYDGTELMNNNTLGAI